MKKALSVLLAFVICLTLYACGKSEAVKKVEEQISAIGMPRLNYMKRQANMGWFRLWTIRYLVL